MRSVRLYLRLGDRCYHVSREEWGLGSVVEEMTSTIEGGTCLIRVLFEDGSQRTFHNDLDSEMCCYYMGLRREASFNWDLQPTRRGRQVTRRSLSRE
jgi:hypothetical protein